jgi:hypothetical protein
LPHFVVAVGVEARADQDQFGAVRLSFAEARQRVHQALARQETERGLYEVFVRLYTLRNQLMHGGATWNKFGQSRPGARWASATGARAVRDLGVMMDHPAQFEGKPFYPVVSDSNQTH